MATNSSPENLPENLTPDSHAAGISFTLILITLFAICVSAFGNRLEQKSYGWAVIYLLLAIMWMVAVMTPANLLGANGLIIFGIMISWIISTAIEFLAVLPAAIIIKFFGNKND